MNLNSATGEIKSDTTCNHVIPRGMKLCQLLQSAFCCFSLLLTCLTLPPVTHCASTERRERPLDSLLKAKGLPAESDLIATPKDKRTHVAQINTT